MNKKQLRLTYKKRRRELSELDKDKFNLEIANQLIKLPIWDKNYFHVFLPIETQIEVDTTLISPILLRKDKQVVISKSNFETGAMTHYLLKDNTKLVLNEYKIPEPEDGIIIETSKLDVVFVPLLAFDKKGNRLGYGKGFYDRFLKQCRPDCIKIGLSFFEVNDKQIDVNEFDIALDYCVTANKIYKFN